MSCFTPAGFDDLDGMPFAAKPFAFSTKDDMGDYLEVYAARFEPPVYTGVGRSVAPGLPGDPSWHRGPWLACRRVRTAIRGLEDP
ncbi:MAG TPA: hypothetical protein VF170_14950 [Planctomycetaceae bacterium]